MPTAPERANSAWERLVGRSSRSCRRCRASSPSCRALRLPERMRERDRRHAPPAGSGRVRVPPLRAGGRHAGHGRGLRPGRVEDARGVHILEAAGDITVRRPSASGATLARSSRRPTTRPSASTARARSTMLEPQGDDLRLHGRRGARPADRDARRRAARRPRGDPGLPARRPGDESHETVRRHRDGSWVHVAMSAACRRRRPERPGDHRRSPTRPAGAGARRRDHAEAAEARAVEACA